jgi:dTDP-4-dehydrorhamnose reductase
MSALRKKTSGTAPGPRVLVIGCSGQLATSLAALAWPAGTYLACRGREHFALTDPAATLALVQAERPDVILNAAAYTAVDRAETESELAYAVNRDGPAHLATAARALGASLIHVSTDYVFDGSKATPYRETDALAPLGVYGASKAAGEAAVRERLEDHVIVRTSWVYAPFGTNFVRTMLRLGGERPELSVVDDQHGVPTYAPDLAAALARLALSLAGGKRDGFGTFHLCGGGAPTTWYGFAAALFARAAVRGAPVPRLTPIPTSAYPTPARRPANSVLETTRIAQVHGLALRPWHEALDEALTALLPPPVTP